MKEYTYNNLGVSEILSLFSSLPESEEGDVLLLQKGCKTHEVDEADIIDFLYKGWSVIV